MSYKHLCLFESLAAVIRQIYFKSIQIKSKKWFQKSLQRKGRIFSHYFFHIYNEQNKNAKIIKHIQNISKITLKHKVPTKKNDEAID